MLMAWLILWLAHSPPWHLIERTYAKGIVCTTQQKVGEETTRTGKVTTVKPVGAGPTTYKAISLLPRKATIAQETALKEHMMNHCNWVAKSPQHFPSVVEIQQIYTDPQEWVQTGYISIKFQ